MNISGFISQSQTEEKAKYSVVIKKLTSLISIFDKLYGNSYHKKLIQTDYNTLKLTSSPVVIVDNIKINHPLVKLLIEYVKKLDILGDSSKYFLLIVKYLIDESFKIVEKGVKPTILGELYRDISSELNGICSDLVKEINIDFDSKDELKNNSDNTNELKNIENNTDELKNNLNNMKKNINSINISRPTFSLLLDSLINDNKIKNLFIDAIYKTKSFSSEKIRIHKITTGTLDDSFVVEGMVFDKIPDSIKKNLDNGTSSIYNCPLDIRRAELKSTILMSTSEELYNFSKEEIDFIKEKVDSLKSDLIICSGKIDNIFLDFCNKANKVIFKIMSKHDLRRIRDCLGGSISPVLEPTKEGKVLKMEVIDNNYTIFIGNDIQTIVLRNSLDVILDEYERIINKTLRAISKNIKDNKITVVEGSGLFEKNMKKKFNSISCECSDLNKKYAYKSIAYMFNSFKVYNKVTYDIYNTKLRAMKYALDFIAIMYETEDYLIGIQEKMNINPRMNEDWDEDH